jgi:hypothetical protein
MRSPHVARAGPLGPGTCASWTSGRGRAISVALAGHAAAAQGGALEAVGPVGGGHLSDALDLRPRERVGHAGRGPDRVRRGRSLAGRAAVFDVILANLPYVRHDAMGACRSRPRSNPRLALDGGVAGSRLSLGCSTGCPTPIDRRWRRPDRDRRGSGEAIVGATRPRGCPAGPAMVELDLAGLPRVARISRISRIAPGSPAGSA